ncbi:MAG TPA: SPOR domain-containing protein [Pelomicrobium sp.]|nr:SPOR domain-containing protein [Pelomicrobium sp.]
MRVLLFALLLANALMAAALYLHVPEGPEAGLLQQQIEPQKIRIVPLEEARTSMTSRAPTAPTLTACLEWSGFGPAEADRVRARLESDGLAAKTSARTGEHPSSFWVYLPPAANREETNRRIEALKTRGLTDYFVVQDQGRWRNALSLGLFRSEESAQKFLEEVRAKGFDYAELREGGPKAEAVTLVIRDPSDAEAERVAALRADFPGTELKAATCAQP